MATKTRNRVAWGHNENCWFYVACLAVIVTRNTDWLSLGLAWLFVAARVAHAYIHTGHNGLKHRRLAFLAGTAVLALLWLKLLGQLLVA
ncbi:MAPEG family protein [Methylovulum psychrotolerans]|uniref:MAPEG family protein n=1 Tax=Methylovulum psychrotolerans TaxID=1704499 RepID=UPI001BFF11F5|nr:MAPEG family protein [Methylovulum psychrotolerans]MBT9096441.1 MAPEG family protein [Methylovulum psychrotolerans]